MPNLKAHHCRFQCAENGMNDWELEGIELEMRCRKSKVSTNCRQEIGVASATGSAAIDACFIARQTKTRFLDAESLLPAVPKSFWESNCG